MDNIWRISPHLRCPKNCLGRFTRGLRHALTPAPAVCAALLATTAPASTPGAIIDRLHAESEKILRVPEVKEVVLGMGTETGGATPKQANAIVRDEMAVWAQVVKRAGIKVE